MLASKLWGQRRPLAACCEFLFVTQPIAHPQAQQYFAKRSSYCLSCITGAGSGKLDIVQVAQRRRHQPPGLRCVACAPENSASIASTPSVFLVSWHAATAPRIRIARVTKKRYKRPHWPRVASQEPLLLPSIPHYSHHYCPSAFQPPRKSAVLPLRIQSFPRLPQWIVEGHIGKTN